MADPLGNETSRRDIDRLVAFSDGVFAIAITLLVLSIQIPELPQGPNLNQQLWDAMQNQVQEVFAYFLSFLVIGRYWLIHHRIFRLVIAADLTLFGLNLLLLSLIAFMPYATEVYGRYSDTSPAIILYSLTVGITGMVLAILLEHLNNKKLLHTKVRSGFLSQARPRALFIPAVFLLAIPFAFFTDAAWIVWLVGLLAGRFLFSNPLGSFSDPFTKGSGIKRKTVFKRGTNTKKNSVSPRAKK